VTVSSVAPTDRAIAMIVVTICGDHGYTNITRPLDGLGRAYTSDRI